jgi:hypothetical protein
MLEPAQAGRVHLELLFHGRLDVEDRVAGGERIDP